MIKRFSSILPMVGVWLGSGPRRSPPRTPRRPTPPRPLPVPRRRLPPPQDATIESRVADLEAYVNNGARGSDATPPTFKTNLTGSGPGHNGWMMVSTALVLMMTPARPGALLRRPRPAQERPFRAGPVLRHHRPGHDPLVLRRLQPGLQQQRRLGGQGAIRPSAT